MHPIERLRYVARATHVPADVLARETAMALADFVGDDSSLLIACQRILARQPTSAVMVWLVAHILGAPNQRRALWDAVDALEQDATAKELSRALPDDAKVAVAGWSDVLGDSLRRRGDVSVVAVDIDGSSDVLVDQLTDAGHEAYAVDTESMGQALADCDLLLVELGALGPGQAIASIGALGTSTVARHWELPVWGIAATGVALPARMYGGLVRRWHEHDHHPLWQRESEEFATSLLDQVVTNSGLKPVDAAIAASECPLVPELY